MIRVEVIFFSGMLVGLVVGVILSRLVRKYLAARDRRLVRVQVNEAIREADTPELLNELSKRDDLGRRQ
jgi:hypothetical protein